MNKKTNLAPTVAGSKNRFATFTPTGWLEANQWWMTLPQYSLVDSTKKRSIQIYLDDISRVVPISKSKHFRIEYIERAESGAEDRHGFFLADRVPDELLSRVDPAPSRFEHSKFILLRLFRSLPYSLTLYCIATSLLIFLIGGVTGEAIFNLKWSWARSLFGLSNCNGECQKIAIMHFNKVFTISLLLIPYGLLPVPLAIFLRRRTRDINWRGFLKYETSLCTFIALMILKEKHEQIINSLSAAWNFFHNGTH